MSQTSCMELDADREARLETNCIYTGEFVQVFEVLTLCSHLVGFKPVSQLDMLWEMLCVHFYTTRVTRTHSFSTANDLCV